MSKYQYAANIPELVKPEIQRFLTPFEDWIPSWCAKVIIEWNSSDDGTCCIYTGAYYDYRYAKITFCPAFFDTDTPENTRWEMVQHDILHIYTCVLYKYMRKTVEKLIPDEADETLREIIFEELREKHESITEDLSNLMNQIRKT